MLKTLPEKGTHVYGNNIAFYIANLFQKALLFSERIKNMNEEPKFFCGSIKTNHVSNFELNCKINDFLPH